MPQTPPLDVPTGYRVAGFEVTRQLGGGGWGRVYAGRACDDHTREVALKFVPATSGLRADVLAREVRFGLTADHPCLVRSFGAHVVTDRSRPDLDGTVVLIMERATASLADVMRAGPVPDPVRVLTDICRGLAHLHGRRVVHGDLKPSNVLVVDGRVALADFGLSTELEGTHGYAPHLGSVDYVPPEWWSEPLDDRGARLRPAQDMWAFGVIAFQVLGGGRWPFPGQTPRARALNAAAAPPSLDALPPAWRGIVRDCLSPRHAARPSSAAVLARVEALDGTAPPVSAPVRPRRSWVAAVAAVTVVGAVVGAAAVVVQAQGDPVSGRPASVTASGTRTAAPLPDPDADRVAADGLLVDAGVPRESWGTVRADEHVAVTDVTGDGRRDVLVVRTGDDGTDVRTWAHGAEGEPAVLRIAGPLRSLGVAAGDVTGDGFGDLVAYHRDRSGAAEVAVWRGGPGGLTPTPTVVFTNSVDLANAKLAVGDVTGDGTADIVLARAAGDAMTLHLVVGGPRVGGAGNKVALVERPLEVSAIAAADVTGDGHADLLVRSRDAAGRGELHIAEGNRAGFAERVLTPLRVAPEHAVSMLAGTDVTGDGAPDAVLGRPLPGASAVQLRRLAGGGRTLGPDEMLLTVGLSRLVI
jgi:hypothetical protein